MPSLYVIAGPNGAGKTTFIKRFAPRHLALLDFLNADELARGLSPLAPERAQMEAGRLMLDRIRRFIADRRSFAMETTLSGRTYRLLLKQAKEAGYAAHLDILVLPSVEDSIRRVANRAIQGGHNVRRRTCAAVSDSAYGISLASTDRSATLGTCISIGRCGARGSRHA
jgi:predicted ABC-type ATPase